MMDGDSNVTGNDQGNDVSTDMGGTATNETGGTGMASQEDDESTTSGDLSVSDLPGGEAQPAALATDDDADLADAGSAPADDTSDEDDNGLQPA